MPSFQFHTQRVTRHEFSASCSFFPPTICPSYAPHSEKICVCSSHTSSETGSVWLLGGPGYRLALRSLFKTRYAMWRWESDTRRGRCLIRAETKPSENVGKKTTLSRLLTSFSLFIYRCDRHCTRWPGAHGLPLCWALCGGMSVHTMFCTACTMNSINVTNWKLTAPFGPVRQLHTTWIV